VGCQQRGWTHGRAGSRNSGTDRRRIWLRTRGAQRSGHDGASERGGLLQEPSTGAEEGLTRAPRCQQAEHSTGEGRERRSRAGIASLVPTRPPLLARADTCPFPLISKTYDKLCREKRTVPATSCGVLEASTSDLVENRGGTLAEATGLVVVLRCRDGASQALVHALSYGWVLRSRLERLSLGATYPKLGIRVGGRHPVE
jgi:hypothetical protein